MTSKLNQNSQSNPLLATPSRIRIQTSGFCREENRRSVWQSFEPKVSHSKSRDTTVRAIQMDLYLERSSLESIATSFMKKKKKNCYKEKQYVLVPNKQINNTIVPINQNASCEPPFCSSLLHSFQRTCVYSTASAFCSLSPSSLSSGCRIACVAPIISGCTTTSPPCLHIRCSAGAGELGLSALWVCASRGQTGFQSVCSAPPG